MVRERSAVGMLDSRVTFVELTLTIKADPFPKFKPLYAAKTPLCEP